MNLEELRDKSILLLGKPRAFNNEEFIKEIEFYNINLASEYNEDVVMVVDGKMMTPYEQNKSDELYELHSKELEFISIDTLERELVKHINPNTLLMSLLQEHSKYCSLNAVALALQCFVKVLGYRFERLDEQNQTLRTEHYGYAQYLCKNAELSQH